MALKADTNFISPLYQASDNTHYRMSIQLRQNGLSYAIVSPEKAQLMRLQDFNIPTHTDHTKNANTKNYIQDTIKAIVQDTSIDIAHIEYISVMVDTPYFTVLPNTMLRKQTEAEQQLHFAFKLPPNYDIVLLNNTQQNMSFVMGISTSIHNALHSIPNFKLQHPSNVVFDMVQQAAAQLQKQNYLIAYLSHKQLFLSAYQDTELQFTNSFSFENKEDFIYYMLLCYKQLDIDTNRSPLYLLGDISRQSQLFNICWQYIRTVKFWNTGSIMLHSPLAAHQYHLLTQAALCE